MKASLDSCKIYRFLQLHSCIQQVGNASTQAQHAPNLLQWYHFMTCTAKTQGIVWLANPLELTFSSPHPQALINKGLASLEATASTATKADTRSTKKGRLMRPYMAEYDDL